MCNLLPVYALISSSLYSQIDTLEVRRHLNTKVFTASSN